MRPCVRGDLVTIGDHSLDYSWVWSCDIDWALAEIVASDEERRMEPELLEHIQKVVGIFIRSVIVGQSNYIIFNTVIYVVVVSDTPKERAWVSECRRSCWCSVGIARAVLILTLRVSTIVLGCTAITLYRFSFVRCILVAKQHSPKESNTGL